jgi:hypothetical protein
MIAKGPAPNAERAAEAIAGFARDSFATKPTAGM